MPLCKGVKSYTCGGTLKLNTYSTRTSDCICCIKYCATMLTLGYYFNVLYCKIPANKYYNVSNGKIEDT